MGTPGSFENSGGRQAGLRLRGEARSGPAGGRLQAAAATAATTAMGSGGGERGARGAVEWPPD